MRPWESVRPPEGYITSSVTSVMITLALTHQIHSLADLPGKPVGVFTGSVAEEFGIPPPAHVPSTMSIPPRLTFLRPCRRGRALQGGRIAAIVGDAPVSEYQVKSHPEVPVTVGPIFEPDKHGFGLTLNNGLTRPLAVELIRAHESGLVEQLRWNYFGDRS